jgi:hypothetical protein
VSKKGNSVAKFRYTLTTLLKNPTVGLLIVVAFVALNLVYPWSTKLGKVNSTGGESSRLWADLERFTDKCSLELRAFSIDRGWPWDAHLAEGYCIQLATPKYFDDRDRAE